MKANYKQLPSQVNAADFYVIDLQFRHGEPPVFFKNSVHFEWQQLSQLGEQSRGYLKRDLNSLQEDLRNLGLHPKKKIVIIGRGLKGRGEEGRVAYTLLKVGFKNVFISSKEKLLSYGFPTQSAYPPVAKKSEPFKVNQRTDLSIEKNEVLKLLKKKKFLSCIDVRPPAFLPEAINGQQPCERIFWHSFFNKDLEIKTDAVQLLNHFSKAERIVVLSEAGLASASVMLAMREIGFEKTVLFEGGYTGLRALVSGLKH